MAYKPLLVSPGDKHQAMYQGLLNLGQNLSASGGYSKMPTSFMSALGQGGAAFGQGYQSEIERAKKGQKSANGVERKGQCQWQSPLSRKRYMFTKCINRVTTPTPRIIV